MIRLLIVDDSALMRRVLGTIFQAEGDFTLAFAADGEEALALLHDFAPDVVTLDVHMPRMDGLACLDRIMLERPCPVVMVSSLTAAGAELTLEAMQLGAVDVIPKPEGTVSLALEDLFERRVDLVTLASVQNPFFLQEIAASRRMIYAAESASAERMTRKEGEALAAHLCGDGCSTSRGRPVNSVPCICQIPRLLFALYPFPLDNPLSARYKGCSRR